MATLLPTIPWGKCNFVYTEIDHDLNLPINTKIRENPNFISAIRSGLDVGTYGCSTVDPDKNEFRNDKDIVGEIFGKSIDDINSLPNDTEHMIASLAKMNNSTTESIQVPCSMYKEQKVGLTGETRFHNSMINKMFNPPSVFNPVNLYFIIDSGDELIARYLKPLASTNMVDLHVIHSMTTIGDSATKKKPNAKDWKTNNPSIKIHSWYYDHAIIIPGNHDDFMSKYTITNRLISTFKWHIGQTWTDGSNPVYGTNDAHTDNNKPAVKEKLQKLIDSGALTSTTMTADNQSKFSVAIQTKRSGDHLQILFAKEFPEILANPANANRFIYYAGSDNSKLGVSGAPPTGTLAEIKARTYFVTGDWPAFCYACYLGVNSVIIARSKGYVLRVWVS
jgi:hypothetical protein